MHVVRDTKGRYWVGQRDGAKVYSPEGEYLRQVGRAGDGPGEFRWAEPQFVDEAGLVHVFDSRSMRESVFDNEFALANMRALPSMGLRDVARIPGTDRVVINMDIRTPDLIGLQLHILDDEEVVQSFGGLPEEGIVDPLAHERVVAAASNGTIYSVGPFEYQIEEWSHYGVLLRSLTGPVLNEMPIPPGPFSDEKPPTNKIFDMQVGARGYLWLIRWQRRSDWRESMTERRMPDGRIQLATENLSLEPLYEVYLDVVDPENGRVLASQPIGALGVRFAGERLLFANRFSSEGAPQVVIVEAHFNAPSGAR